MAEVVREHERAAEKQSGDVSFWPIFKIALAWLVFVCVACAILAVLYYKVGHPRPTPDVDAFPAPRLVSHPGSEYYRMVAGQKQALKTYGWIDRKAGIAHIPIRRAMDMNLHRSDPYAPIEGGGGRR